MRSDSTLFNKGYLTRQPSLSDVLDAHKRGVINEIRSISDLDQMTDSFLERLVKDSLVEPLAIPFDKMTRKLRAEEFDGSAFPGDFNVQRGHRYPKQVARISVPFSGDPKLLEYTPNQSTLSFPRGEVSGDTIQFDVILWGYHDDASRVKEQVDGNRRLLELYATNVSKQVKEFNESLPAQVKAAFTAKLDELAQQYAVFDDLGIPDEPEPPVHAISAASPRPKKEKARAEQIIQYVGTMYVQQLNQTNYNVGDVNNAIQSGE